MMRGSDSVAALLLLALSGLPIVAAAASLDDALRRCGKESDSALRLACFDGIVRQLPQVEADRVGMTAEIRHQRAPAAATPAQEERLTARIVALRQAPQGQWVFTLDNQQVWQATEARSNITFAVGEEVRVQPGAMSSLWLVADKHRSLRIKRLR